VDAVRFISNRSSGKMGYAIASEARLRGAQVILITGPTHLSPPADVETISVRSARQMAEAVFSRFAEVDVVVMAAAVSDYQPTEVGEGKIKKGTDVLHLSLAPTTDILKELGRRKEGQVLVGFAAESANLRDYAVRKLHEKRLDLIVANSIVGESSAFGSDSNEVLFLGHEQEECLPRLSKQEVAEKLWNRIETLMNLLPAQ
jgi:phosphopantothenoylcysteine decarboxylase / phosphopantothenate---cysteine ligase